jgi:hypothetical protein
VRGDRMNIKDLTPITKVQAFEEPKEMYVWNNCHKEVFMHKVYGIFNISQALIGALVNINGTFTYFENCAEIPKPKTRERTANKIKGYLHELSKDAYIECVNHEVSRTWEYYVLCDFVHSSCRFRKIDKNGKVTEFKLPDIEVES